LNKHLAEIAKLNAKNNPEAAPTID